MDFGCKHYVPILKTKAGERWAISYIPAIVRKHITPVLELHPHKKKAPQDHLEDTCESLEAAWDGEVFLDTYWLHPGKLSDPNSKEPGDPAVIKTVFNCARSHLTAIPVVRLGLSKASRKEIRTITKTDGRGVMFRVRPNELDQQHSFDALLNDLEMSPQEVHLLLDYKKKEMNLEDDISLIPYLKKWRTLTCASGAFPRTLKDFTLSKWHKIPRTDWTSWNKSVSAVTLARKPTYSDYTSRDPGAPMDGGLPSVNLRYARNDHWLVRVGGKVTEGASGEMKKVCASLVSLPKAFDGPDFSEGDREIYERTKPDVGPGNAGQWVQWGVNHHLVFTARTIASHPSL